MFHFLDDILDRNKTLEPAGAVDNGQFLDTVFLKYLLGFLQTRAFGRSDEFFVGHELLDFAIEILFKDYVAVGQNTHDLLSLVDNNDAGDRILVHQILDQPDRRFFINGYRVHDHTALGALHLLDFGLLLLDRHVFVDNPDAAFLGKGNCHRRFGDRIHCCTDNRYVQFDISGEFCCNTTFVGQDFRILRD